MNFKTIAIFFIVLTGFMIRPVFAAEIHCPTHLSMSVEHWIVNNLNQNKEKLNAKNIFNRSEIIEGVPGDEKKEYPVILAPDKEEKKKEHIVQTWLFKNSEQPMLLVCHYQNTDIYLSTVLPKSITHCEQTLITTNPKSKTPSGAVVKSMTCN